MKNDRIIIIFVPMTRAFKVAGHSFHLEVPGPEFRFGLAGQYEPFEVPPVDRPLFTLSLVATLPGRERTLVLDSETDPGETKLRLFRSGDGWIVEMAPDARMPVWGTLALSEDFSTGELLLARDVPGNAAFAVGNSLMLMYAFCTATLGTLEMHASVIRNAGRAYLFLARSGTGKSTHSQQWLEAIPGSELLNDDNPIVRVFPDGRVRVFGSPWSGKTPCYRAEEAQAGAFVRIRRCPENRITRLGLVEAYASLYSSCSGFRAVKRMADGLHETIGAIVTKVPCFVLDCRPDHDAARVCAAAVTKEVADA